MPLSPPMTVLLAHEPYSARVALRAALEAERDILVVAEAESDEAIVSQCAQARPAVVLMDCAAARIDGYQTTRTLMAKQPVPIVLLATSMVDRSSANVSRALRDGALSVHWLPIPSDPQFRASVATLVRTLRAMVRVQVRRATAPPTPSAASSHIDAIAIVASTGGPSAVATVLNGMGLAHPPVLLVQHLADGFVEGFADWLSQSAQRPVVIARNGERAERSTVYIAPEHHHLGVDPMGHLVVSDAEPIALCRPSGTFLLRAMARHLGARARAAVLTGMGADGADGAVALRAAGGAVVTQDEQSSTVYGMPQQALVRGGSDVSLPLEHIAHWLLSGEKR